VALGPGASATRQYFDWLPVAAGLLAVYGVTFYGLATTLWRADEYAHGPIILGIVGWLVWRRRSALVASGAPHAMAGLGIIAAGLLVYIVGRSYGIGVFEVGSLIPVLIGVVLAMRGVEALRQFSIPIIFVLFLIPLPEVLVDALTGPLKREVSDVAERLLYAANYPVGRTGVVLIVGRYEMLVADACSGLNSMFSLTALELLYLHVVGRASWLHNALIVASTLPIAFAANVVRVLILVLITYHFGDEAGQGFLHSAAGVVLVLAALALLLSLDALLARFVMRKGPVSR